jgi:hypothetical protein
MAIDLTTDLGKVRLLISDMDEANLIFQDPEIGVFLDMTGDVVLLAAAKALEVIAGNEAMVQKRIKILDLQTDGPAVSKELRELAKTWREEYDATLAASDEDLGFDIAEMVVDPFTLRERLLSQYRRNY